MDADGPEPDQARGGRRRRPGYEPRDHELARLVQTLPRDDPRREAACEQLVTRYQALVRSCAQRYRDSPEPIDELMQVGYVGLLKAINNFDTEVGESLPAVRPACVSGEIKRYFRDKRWLVRVKRSVQELRLDMRKASGELAHAAVPDAARRGAGQLPERERGRGPRGPAGQPGVPGVVAGRAAA